MLPHIWISLSVLITTWPCLIPGGFEWYVDPPPDLELWARWTAAGCVSGLMHEQGGGKGEGPKTHIFDFENGTEIWRKFAKLRTQLFPYIYTQAHIAREVIAVLGTLSVWLAAAAAS